MGRILAAHDRSLDLGSSKKQRLLTETILKGAGGDPVKLQGSPQKPYKKVKENQWKTKENLGEPVILHWLPP